MESKPNILTLSEKWTLVSRVTGSITRTLSELNIRTWCTFD